MDKQTEELLAEVAAWQAKVAAVQPPDGFTDGEKCDLCGRPVANMDAFNFYSEEWYDKHGEGVLTDWDGALCFGMCDIGSLSVDPPETGDKLFLALEVLRLRALVQP